MLLMKLQPHEAGLHRQLRLRALLDSPNSFGETYADVAARPESYWEEFTRSVTEPGPQAMFLASDGEHVVGSVYAVLDRERSGGGRVGGMWVDPAWRMRGVATALLAEVFGWARLRGLAGLALWAPLHSPAALAAYSRAGFRETGVRKPFPLDPALQIVEMQVRL